jgi:hypothetical protein
LDCTWARAGTSVEPREDQPDADTQANAPWTPLPRTPGILLGAGWRAAFSEQGGRHFSGGSGAEIIVQRHSGPKGVVALEVEPIDAEGVELAVHKDERALGTYQLYGRERLRLVPPLAEGRAGVLRLSVTCKSGVPAGKESSPEVRLFSAAWEQAAGAAGAGESGRNDKAVASEQSEWEGTAGDAGLYAGAIGTPEPGLAAASLHNPSPDSVGPAFLHTNACGDFTLLAREHWFDLRGYPEFDLFSMNIDSVFCYSAHHGGAPEEFLPDPMRVYHIEHATGSGFTPEGQARLFERIAAKGIPWVDYQQVMDWAVEMRRLDAPLIFNREDWGFAKIDLTERTLSRAKGTASSKTTSRGV